jgi:hypothetical protein
MPLASRRSHRNSLEQNYTMLQFLDQKALWPTLKKLLKRFRGKNLVAVAYLGKAASRLLPLGTVICALTERNAKSGLVCPEEIEKFFGAERDVCHKQKIRRMK